ncbi:MAG: ABC transporter permease [[Eubacterium] sulci]|nr:peptide ABC transporter permease [Eubacterium sulci ATCC 35585]MBF1134954.1 ABC transporter permease [[Eubacterium] sulci]DAT21234.1 MAG TPA: ABC-type dipeptide/oligopeptide/nickel transport system, permease component [Caudoviricetes sp.]EUC78413.1 ABC transporter, permease protein [Eubacterium sulci ATCC 35585]MBF1136552.1 ABC transporter permease [[Eubacterium] sulci]
MASYLTKRILRSFITLFIVCTIVFCLLRLMPIEGYFNNFDKLTESQVQRQLEMKGLKDPLPVQLGHFYKDLIHGDLGKSNRYRPGVEITKILADKIPVSMWLGAISLVISLLLGIPLGRVMARYKGRIPDHLGTIFIVLINAVPAVVYYLFIQMYGTSILGIPILFTRGKWITYILPVFSLALGNISYYAMWLRRYMIDESNKDYVKLAVAKGMKSRDVMNKQIFRNAFVPLIQYIPTSFLLTLVGSIYIESLYSIPGMGGLLVKSIQGQDNTIVQALVLIYSALSIAGLIIGDIMMTMIDPRISFSKKGGAR